MTIDELVKRLEAATGPDRELDAELYDAFIEPLTWQVVSDSGHQKPPCYTASLDAAVALVERVLPGRGLMMARGRTRKNEPLWGIEVLASDFCPVGKPPVIAEAEHEDPALALTLAACRAIAGINTSKP